MGISKVKDKIRKLLALAESDNEHEAAQALGRAQALMEKHEVCEAEFGSPAIEAIEEASLGGEIGKLLAWRRWLLHAAATHNGCGGYIKRAGYRKSVMRLCGRPSDITRAMHIYDECVKVVDRLARVHCRGRGRGYAAAFRCGVVRTIQKEMREERGKLRKEMEGAVSETALVIVDTRSKDSRDWMNAKYNLRRASSAQIDHRAMADGVSKGAGAYGQAARRKMGGGPSGSLSTGRERTVSLGPRRGSQAS